MEIKITRRLKDSRGLKGRRISEKKANINLLYWQSGASIELLDCVSWFHFVFVLRKWQAVPLNRTPENNMSDTNKNTQLIRLGICMDIPPPASKQIPVNPVSSQQLNGKQIHSMQSADQKRTHKQPVENFRFKLICSNTHTLTSIF